MKKHIAIIITIIFTFVSIFSFTVPAKADLVGGNVYQVKKILQDWNDGKNKDATTLLKFINNLQSIGGFIVNPINQLSNLQDFISALDGASSGSHSITGYPAQGTDQEKIDFMIPYMQDNVNIDNSNNNVSINDNSRNIIDSFNNYYINNNGYRYVYTFSITENLTDFSNGDVYNALRRYLNTVNDFAVATVVTDPPRAKSISMNNLALVYRSGFNQSACYVELYNRTSWQKIGFQNISCYGYDSNSKEFVPQNGWYFTNDYFYVSLYEHNTDENLTRAQYAMNSGLPKSYIMYNTLQDLQRYSTGILPYYINSSVYNNYDNSTGDYTFSYEDSNQVTFGDIQTYVDSYNTTNGTNPSDSEINIFIDTYVPNNPEVPDDNNGGSSGSAQGGAGGNASASANAVAHGGNSSANNEGINITINNNHSLNLGLGTVSGNGSGGTVSGNGSGTVGNIFGWLGSIGETIGNLIKGLGEALVGIFEGLADAITTILGSIPNIFTPLIEYVFGGLPDEIKAVITLGITAIITVGVIRAIKK